MEHDLRLDALAVLDSDAETWSGGDQDNRIREDGDKLGLRGRARGRYLAADSKDSSFEAVGTVPSKP